MFDDTNVSYPYPFLFRWNEELEHLAGLWGALGMPSYLTPFKAAYDASGGCFYTAYFSGADGFITFNPCGTWAPKFLMAHEAGHNLQYALQGYTLLGGGLPHSACQEVSEVSGFTEGFADWHGEFFEWQGRESYGFPCSGSECYSPCSTRSHWVEANVAAFFWDIFDSANVSPYDDTSGQTMVDTVSYPTSLLLNWGYYTTFPMFYGDYTARGLWGGGLPATNLLKVANKVDLP